MIKVIHVKNYKSIKDLYMPLKNLNVFIGPNNCGKSNIIDALSFLSDMVSLSPWAEALYRRRSFKNIMFGFKNAGEIAFEVELELSDKEFLYELVIQHHEPTQAPQITSEILRDLSTQKDLISIKSGSGTYFSFNKNKYEEIHISTVGLNFLKNSLYEAPYRRIFDYFNSWVFCHPIPQIIRESQVISDITFKLDKYGKELDRVMDSIYRKYFPDVTTKIDEFLKNSFDEFERLWYEPREGTLFLKWKEKGFDAADKLVLSDGILKMLYLVSLIYNPEPPPLVAIEEPENYIHPRLIQDVSEGLKDLATKTQVIISTHSTALVEFFNENSLVYVEKVGGQTVWQGFDPTKDEPGSFKDKILKGLWG